LQESVEMAAREEGQEHPHERMASMRPEEGETPSHDDNIDEHGKEDHGNAEHTGITPPVHGLSPSYRIVFAVFFPGDTGVRTTGGVVNLLPIDMLNEHKDTRRPGSSRLCGGGKARDVLPGVESLSHHLTVFGGGEEVTSRAEVLGDGPIGREEALGVPW